MENPIKKDDLGVPLFLETPIPLHILTSMFLFIGCEVLGLMIYSDFGSGRSIVKFRGSTHQKEKPRESLVVVSFRKLCIHYCT